MKLSRILPATAAVASFLSAYPAVAADKMVTLGDHVSKMAGEVCKTMMTSDCKSSLSEDDKKDMPADVGACVKELTSGVDKEDAKVEVPEAWSNKCVDSIKQIKAGECKKTIDAMASGPCDAATIAGAPEPTPAKASDKKAAPPKKKK